MEFLSQKQLINLRSIDTPTVANAVEMHKTRDNTEGFMGWDIKCQFPDLGVMVGQAVTATLDTTTPGRVHEKSARFDMFHAVEDMPAPTVIVLKDISSRPFHGCHFGDGLANIAKRLGAIGLVTDGGVRDVETVHNMGFHMFSKGLVPAHGNFGFCESQIPVEISNVSIRPGDVIHADVNGVVVFPTELVDFIIESAHSVHKKESEQFSWVQSDDFSLRKLRDRS